MAKIDGLPSNPDRPGMKPRRSPPLPQSLLLQLLPLLMLALLLLPLHAAQASSFADSLPPQLASDPNLCAYAPCQDVMPGADSFSPRKGHPPYVEAYKTTGERKRLLGYIFLSTDIADIPGYSGKPIVTLIGMNTEGVFTGVKILKHSEPLVLSGIPVQVLLDFIHQYVGKYVGDKVEIGESRIDQGVVGVDAITSATVTVMSFNQIVMRSGVAVAHQAGILKATPRQPARFTENAPLTDWPTLVNEGSVQRLTVTQAEVGQPNTGKPYIDLYFGILNAPGPGKSLLGEAGYENLMSRLKPGETAIFMVANGTASFKGFGFVHGGIYDRIAVAQDLDNFSFRDIDSLVLDSVKAKDAPAFSEAAVFILRNPNFSSAYPWRLIFRGVKTDRKTLASSFVTFDQPYWLPERHLEGGRPAWQPPDPTWLRVWQNRPVAIACFIAFLLVVAVTYALRDRLIRRARRKDKRWVSVPKYLIWAVSFGFVGVYLMAQPSITQVLTLFHALLFKWDWELFLSDPFIFLFWWFIFITTLIWGRGLFCGWLCPYGTMTEALYKIAGKLGLARFQFRPDEAWHERFKWLKYLVFFVLLGTSFYSMEMAETLAEIEPFKTTFLVGVWNRTWPFILFWSVLIVAALFVERPFCKYLCPLGASLAFPSNFRWQPLKRKQECGPCKACGSGCESLAIERSGRIDQRECLLCLDCMVMYYDDHACPPLAQERKRRTKAGEALSPIGQDGYFIPIIPLVDQPPAPPRLSIAAWFGAEISDLFPWRRRSESRAMLFHAFGIIMAGMATWAWLLGAAGKISHVMILCWWLAWSAYEVAARMDCKPHIRDGSWWQRNFRAASWGDMLVYVSVKNVLIAAILFVLMNELGIGPLLQSLPEMPWQF